jgi:hypothetical protein
MDFRRMSDGIFLYHQGDPGHGSPTPSWPSEDAFPQFMKHLSQDNADDGGDSHFPDSPTPSLSSAGVLSPSMIDTGDNSAGNGGDGYFSGAAVSAPVALYGPINIAQAGFGGAANAHQSNLVEFNQSAIKIAGGGGHGGSGNAAIGGNVSAAASEDGSSDSPHHSYSHGLPDFGAIATGDNHAGNGGDGYFSGSLVHASYALFNPINIAFAGYNSSAHAEQTNNVEINQGAFQMAGVGGNGGNGNTASGGHLDFFSHGFGIGSNAIDTGDNSAGNGGNGYFSGSLIDVSVAIYAPINIAIAGYNSTADAYQTNNVSLDQSTVQIAGVGGDGGNGNHALGGDFVMHLLSDHHLLG